jgi:putative transposase
MGQTFSQTLWLFSVQYPCQHYLQRLRDHQMSASMSRPSNPYDNATCESFLKTLKQKEIYVGAYRDFGELSQGVDEFIERYYNCRRLHSALGYRSPEEFERERGQQSRGAGFAAATMTSVVGQR